MWGRQRIIVPITRGYVPVAIIARASLSQVLINVRRCHIEGDGDVRVSRYIYRDVGGKNPRICRSCGVIVCPVRDGRNGERRKPREGLGRGYQRGCADWSLRLL